MYIFLYHFCSQDKRKERREGNRHQVLLCTRGCAFFFDIYMLLVAALLFSPLRLLDAHEPSKERRRKHLGQGPDQL